MSAIRQSKIQVLVLPLADIVADAAIAAAFACILSLSCKYQNQVNMVNADLRLGLQPNELEQPTASGSRQGSYKTPDDPLQEGKGLSLGPAAPAAVGTKQSPWNTPALPQPPGTYPADPPASLWKPAGKDWPVQTACSSPVLWSSTAKHNHLSDRIVVV